MIHMYVTYALESYYISWLSQQPASPYTFLFYIFQIQCLIFMVVFLQINYYISLYGLVVGNSFWN